MITFDTFNRTCATMAQSVERLTRNEKVAGSIPAGSSYVKTAEKSYVFGFSAVLFFAVIFFNDCYLTVISYTKNSPLTSPVSYETFDVIFPS